MAFLSLQRCLLLLILSVLAFLSSSQPLPSPTAFNASVAVGTGVDLVCTVVGYSGGLPLSVTIAKVSDPTSSNPPVIQDGATATLSIEATHLNDSGMYRCTASTTMGESMSETIFFHLEVRNELALVVAPANVTALPGGTSAFSCVFNSPELVVSWFRNGNQDPLRPSSKYLFSEGSRSMLTITDLTYSDNGMYVCQVNNISLPVRFSGSLALTPAYMPLTRLGIQGQSTISTNDQLKIDCREYSSGVPGASLVYWQRDIFTNPMNLTTRGGSRNDPFVDEQGRLDLSAAGNEDEGRYRCIAVDELGARVEQEFFITITHTTGFYLWDQWYMILVYCVVGLTILALIVLAIWFSLSVKFNCCFKAKKVVRKRERVRRSERQLVYKTPVRDEGIDAYAANEFYDEQPYDEEETEAGTEADAETDADSEP